MISPKKLITLARKVRKTAAMGSKTISLTRANTDFQLDSCNKSSVAENGHFVIYTADQRRYVLPLMYLNSSIFLELLNLSEEEFGLSSDGPITLPCDAVFMDCVVLLINRGLAKGLEKSLLNSIGSTNRFSLSASFHQGYEGQHSVVCAY